MKFSLTYGGKCLVFAFDFTSGSSASTILLCSLRKRVWMEARVGCTTTLTSPAARVSAAPGGLGKGHCDRIGRLSVGNSEWVLSWPEVKVLSLAEVSGSEP